MSPAAPESPSEIEDLLALIKTGQLFAVQRWIAEGRPLLPPPEAETRHNGQLCPLYQAVRSGFHSLVEVLVRAGGWPQSQLDEAYELATSAHRSDIARLLRDNGATMEALDFADVCRSMNQDFMEESLRAGCSPSRENAFAHALTGCAAARPLLSFYRRMRSEFPVLDQQASLALAQAARAGKARAAALLAWAGADPFLEVPYNLEDDNWDFSDRDNCFTTTAAEEAIGSGKVEIVKSLKLKPNASQAGELFKRVSWNPSRELVRAILGILPDKNPNVSERDSCPALEALVSRRSPWGYGRLTPEKEDERAIQCIDELLTAGARWNPPPDDFRHIRRGLLERDGLYPVRIIRLLLYTPGACDARHVLELCRTPKFRERFHSADIELWKEITVLSRKLAADESSPPLVQ